MVVVKVVKAMKATRARRTPMKAMRAARARQPPMRARPRTKAVCAATEGDAGGADAEGECEGREPPLPELLDRANEAPRLAPPYWPSIDEEAERETEGDGRERPLFDLLDSANEALRLATPYWPSIDDPHWSLVQELRVVVALAERGL